MTKEQNDRRHANYAAALRFVGRPPAEKACDRIRIPATARDPSQPGWGAGRWVPSDQKPEGKPRIRYAYWWHDRVAYSNSQPIY